MSAPLATVPPECSTLTHPHAARHAAEQIVARLVSDPEQQREALKWAALHVQDAINLTLSRP